MSGISIDPVTVGMFFGGLILALLGLKAGGVLSALKQLQPERPDPVVSGVAAVFADKELQTRQTIALEVIASTLKARYDLQVDEHENEVTRTLKEIQRTQNELAEQMADKKREEDDARANRTANRVDRTVDRFTGKPGNRRRDVDQ